MGGTLAISQESSTQSTQPFIGEEEVEAIVAGLIPSEYQKQVILDVGSSLQTRRDLF
jgi:hypothetical protein